MWGKKKKIPPFFSSFYGDDTERNKIPRGISITLGSHFFFLVPFERARGFFLSRSNTDCFIVLFSCMFVTLYRRHLALGRSCAYFLVKDELVLKSLKITIIFYVDRIGSEGGNLMNVVVFRRGATGSSTFIYCGHLCFLR